MILQLIANKWTQHNSIAICGNIYIGTQEVSHVSVANKISQITHNEQLVNYISNLNGCFSIVVNNEHLQCIIVDKTRLYPLFYKTTNDETIVSDLALELLDNNSCIDSKALVEYQYTGATFEGNTLISNIRQCKPAHITFFGKDFFETLKFHSMESQHDNNKTHDELECEFSRVLENVFARAKATIGNRQVVIPLSGGYDSRLILAMLVKQGIRNVVCFTVGREVEGEQSVAIRVANKLNIPIYRIDFSDSENIMQDFNSDEFRKFCNFMGNFTNFLWLFEYNAVLWLKKRNLIADNAIFIPGHAGDFFAGSHLKKVGISKNISTIRLVNNFLLNSFEYGKPFFSCHLRKTIKKIFSDCKQRGTIPYTAAIEFICQNRIAHNITNSARVYGYLGYECILPLCDKEFCNFFRSINYEQKYNTVFYDTFVEEKIFKPLNINYRKQKSTSCRKQHIKNLMKSFVPRRINLKLKNQTDLVTESYLAKEMLSELVETGVLKNEHDYFNSNEVMMLWYLEFVKKQLHK